LTTIKGEDKAMRGDVQALTRFVKEIFLKLQVREDVAQAVTGALIQASVRGVDSHGIRLVPHYMKGVKQGRINPSPDYQFQETSPSTGVLDACHTFGAAAGLEAARRAIELAKKAGTGHVAVSNSSHFGTASTYALEIARHDMIGMSFTHSNALLKSYAGKRAFFGNNPICVAAPCLGKDPFCLDMATSLISFNKIKQHQEENRPLPSGVATDAEGIETTDPNRASMLLPMGGYKGYGLSMFVEILCSLLTRMPYGPQISKMYETPLSQKRRLGHFVSAIRIDCFEDPTRFKGRLTMMMNELRREPALDPKVPVQVPGDPENSQAQIRRTSGIPMSDQLVKEFQTLSRELNIPFNLQKTVSVKLEV